MSLYQAGVAWVRQTFTWSNSWSSWHERLVLALFLAVGVGLALLTPWLNGWQVIAVWASFALAIVVCSRQGWLQLFGPVLVYDMIRTARRSRYVVMRLLYASLLLSILLVMYLTITADRRLGREEHVVIGVFAMLALLLGMVILFMFLTIVVSKTARIVILTLLGIDVLLFALGLWLMELDVLNRPDPLATAILAEAYFGAFMIVQLILVALLTPAYVSGAIAEEKDRKTLEFMLATDLNNHEIVLSKLLSRLANMTLFLLAGLPILSILQFVGGVDPELMLTGFAATGLTMLGIASVGILFSTLLKRPRDAIALTYLVIIAYGALATTGKAMDESRVVWMHEGLWEGREALTLADLSRVLNTGNPIAGMIDVTKAIQRASLNADLPVLLRNYACFYLLVSVVCIVWSILRIRAIALKQTVAGRAEQLAWWEKNRPVVGNLPMLWKELSIEGRIRFNWLAWVVVVVLVLLTVGSGLLVVGAYSWDRFFGLRDNFWRMSEGVNVWFRIAGTGVACLLLLMVAVRASTSITTERERDTFDALLTTPISDREILWAKLIGCLTGIRLGWLWYGAMMALALFTGGLHPFAVPIVMGAWWVYATLFSMIGLWYSMVCRSSMRASVLTVLTSLFVGGGHWLVMGLCCFFPAVFTMRGSGDGDALFYVVKFEMALTPPIVLGWLSFSWEGLGQDFRQPDFGAEIFFFFILGIFLSLMACLFLWHGLLLPKFREITRREDQILE